MADPFSTVAGVVGIIGVALSNSRQVHNFIKGIKEAPAAINALSSDLKSLSDILEQLVQSTSEEPQALFVIPMRQSLDRCIDILEQLETSISPYVEVLGNGKSKWRRFAWNFKEKKVLALQSRLCSCKDNLQLALLLGLM